MDLLSTRQLIWEAVNLIPQSKIESTLHVKNGIRGLCLGIVIGNMYCFCFQDSKITVLLKNNIFSYKSYQFIYSNSAKNATITAEFPTIPWSCFMEQSLVRANFKSSCNLVQRLNYMDNLKAITLSSYCCYWGLIPTDIFCTWKP